MKSSMLRLTSLPSFLRYRKGWGPGLSLVKRLDTYSWHQWYIHMPVRSVVSQRLQGRPLRSKIPLRMRLLVIVYIQRSTPDLLHHVLPAIHLYTISALMVFAIMWSIWFLPINFESSIGSRYFISSILATSAPLIVMAIPITLPANAIGSRPILGSSPQFTARPRRNELS